MIVAHGMIARRQRTVGSGYLIHIAILLEQPQRLLGLPYVTRMVGQCLLGLCHEIDIPATLGNNQTTRQVVHLLLVYLLGRSLRQDASGTDVIKIVQILGRIVAHLVGVQLADGLHRLALQTHIIIIGGSDNGHLRLRIQQSAALVFVQLVALFVDALQGVDRFLAVFVKLAVTATTLAEAHLLDVAHQQLHLIVGDA